MSSLTTEPTSRPSEIFSVCGQTSIQHGLKKILWGIISNLWHPETNPDGYVSVGVAENMMLQDVLLEYLNTKLELPGRWLTYNDGPTGSLPLRQAFARFLNRHLKPHLTIEPSHVVITNGISSAIEQLACAFADPGEGVLLGRPYYTTFIQDLALRSQAEVVTVDFGEIDPLSAEGVAKYEHALVEFENRTGKRVRALMLCHPHNPLGRCYPVPVIKELMKFCQSHRLHLMSDEIYALSVWENVVDPPSETVAFESVLSIDTAGLIDPDLVHVLWGMSKDFGANGVRIGAFISQSNPALHTAMAAAAMYSYPSGLSDWVTAKLLQDDAFTEGYIRRNQEILSKSHAFIVEQLRRYDIDYVRGCSAGFFVWVNLGKKYLENHPDARPQGTQLTDVIMERLLDKKVFLASTTMFGGEVPGWFRIIFTHPMPYLDEAMRRVMSALEPGTITAT